jgi:1,4-dihydroxy-2-naphthoate octaprenyltransferase
MHAGTVRPRSVLLAGAACFAAGSAIGLGLCAATDWTLLYLGLASVIAGFLYTGWPIHLAYIALGELTVFVFMGPVMVVGAYFVQVERWSWDPVLVSLPIAFLVTAILQANNIRDIEHDREVGKRTIATLVGRKWANREMYFLLAAAFASTVAIAAAGVLPWPALVSLAALPLVRPVVTVIRTETSPRRLTMALLGCVRLHMRFGLLMCAGLVAWVVLERA